MGVGRRSLRTVRREFLWKCSGGGGCGWGWEAQVEVAAPWAADRRGSPVAQCSRHASRGTSDAVHGRGFLSSYYTCVTAQITAQITVSYCTYFCWATSRSRMCMGMLHVHGFLLGYVAFAEFWLVSTRAQIFVWARHVRGFVFGHYAFTEFCLVAAPLRIFVGLRHVHGFLLGWYTCTDCC